MVSVSLPILASLSYLQQLERYVITGKENSVCRPIHHRSETFLVCRGSRGIANLIGLVCVQVLQIHATTLETPKKNWLPSG
jgi:hypothetical protein